MYSLLTVTVFQFKISVRVWKLEQAMSMVMDNQSLYVLTADGDIVSV